MRISIVTISLNQGDYLEQAIDSVAEQRSDGLDVEYIIVDAGSTDQTHSLLEQRREQIDALAIGPDLGPADGLNRGFSMATGSILGFLNADDWLEKGALRTVHNYFARRRDHGGVVGALRVVVERSDSQRTTVRLPTEFTLERYVTERATVLQQSTFFRRSAWARVEGFNVANTTNWDSELFVDMLAAGVRFGRVPDVLASFRVHPTSITGSGRLSSDYQSESRRLVAKHPTTSRSGWARQVLWRARPFTRVAQARRTWTDRRAGN